MSSVPLKLSFIRSAGGASPVTGVSPLIPNMEAKQVMTQKKAPVKQEVIDLCDDEDDLNSSEIELPVDTKMDENIQTMEKKRIRTRDDDVDDDGLDWWWLDGEDEQKSKKQKK